MKTKLLLFFTFISFGLFAQTTHELPWASDGTCDNQQIMIEVGDTVTWTWGAGTHNLRATSGTETFDSGYEVSSFSYTFNQAGSTDYVCDLHASNQYGTVTVVEASGGSETVIAVWDFNNGSTMGVFGDNFEQRITANKSLGFLKEGVQTSAPDANSVVCNTKNGFSAGYLTGLNLTPGELVDGKLHLSITYNLIDLPGELPTNPAGTNFKNAISSMFIKGALNSSANWVNTAANNQRLVGNHVQGADAATGEVTQPYLNVTNVVTNNGVQYGGAKIAGTLGSSVEYAETITIGTTMDFINETSSFWVGSPGQNPNSPYGLTTATAANQSSAWNQVTKDNKFDVILKLLQFEIRTGDGSLIFDQVKVSTGTYENTVASGDGEGLEEPEPALSMQGIIDFSMPGHWMKAVHMVATDDIADLSVYGINAVFHNESASDGAPAVNLTGSASAGDNIIIAKTGGVGDPNSGGYTTQEWLDAYMNASNVFDVIQIANNALPSFNGDDAVELYFNGSVVETYGVVGVDGTGESWEYTDSWAWKEVDGTWTNAAVNCTDNSYYMWDSSCVYPAVVGQQATGTWAPVTSYAHEMNRKGQAGVWFYEPEVAMRRKTNATGSGSGTALEYHDDGTFEYSNLQIRFNSKIDMNSLNTFTMDVYIDAASLTGSSPNQLALKLQDATENEPWTNQNVITQDITPDQWQTVTFTFNGDAAMSRDDVDNIVVQFNSEANNDAVKGYIKNVVGSYTAPVVDPEPAVAAPTPPHAAEDVISILSQHYTQGPAIINVNPGWGQTTILSEVTLNNDPMWKMQNLNYQGNEFWDNPIDISEMEYVHIDVWAPDTASFNFFLLDNNSPEVSQTITTSEAGAWYSVDIPKDLYNSIRPLNESNIVQFKWEGSVPLMFITNLYFWKTPIAAGADASLSDLTVDGTTVADFVSGTLSYNIDVVYGSAVPTIAGTTTDANATTVVTQATTLAEAATIVVTSADTTVSQTYTVNFVESLPADCAPDPTQLEADVISVYSDAYATNIYGELNPGWGQATQMTEIQIGANGDCNTLKYANLNYQGLGYTGTDVTGMDFVHLDYFTLDSTDIRFFLIGNGENDYNIGSELGITTGQWVSVDIPLTHYTAADQSNVYQFKTEGNGTVYLDNLYFWKTPTAAGTDASLSDLTVDGTTVAGFGSGNLSYTVDVVIGSAVPPTIAGTTTDANATTVVTQATTLAEAATIVVTSADTTVSQTYTVNFVESLPADCAPDPTQLEADVISVYSDAYATNIYGELNPGWGQATQMTEIQIGANGDCNTLKYANLNYQGLGYTGTDVTGMDFVHLDYFTLDSTDIRFFLIGNGENDYNIGSELGITTGQWVSVDIPLTHYTNADQSNVYQFKTEGNGTVLLDNLYFWNDTTAGIDDTTMSQFTYYPNPVNDQLTIRAQSNVKDITVFNMLGQIVLRQSPNTKDCLVDMAVMQSGAYFVQISIGNTVQTVRVLKQ